MVDVRAVGLGDFIERCSLGFFHAGALWGPNNTCGVGRFLRAMLFLIDFLILVFKFRDPMFSSFQIPGCSNFTTTGSSIFVIRGSSKFATPDSCKFAIPGSSNFAAQFFALL